VFNPLFILVWLPFKRVGVRSQGAPRPPTPGKTLYPPVPPLFPERSPHFFHPQHWLKGERSPWKKPSLKYIGASLIFLFSIGDDLPTFPVETPFATSPLVPHFQSLLYGLLGSSSACFFLFLTPRNSPMHIISPIRSRT